MGLTTKTPLKEIMRCTILVLSLAIIYATASDMAEDHIIPEESLLALDDDLSEAQQKVNEMTAAGKSDKDCRKLVTETRRDIETNVNSCQKTMDALPNGKECPSRGQKGVKTAREAKDKADKHYKYTVTEVTKASSASVKFGSRTFSSLTEGKCESFYTSSSYTTAEATYKAAVTARTTAKGAAEQADKELKGAIEAAAKAKKEFACQVECVLDGKSNCRCSAAPQCKKAKLTAAVNAAQCVAVKKPVKEEVVNGVAQCGAKSNYVVLYSGPNCTGKKWTVKKDTNFCDVSGMNDNVDSIQGCGPDVHILHHCDKNSATIWKNNGNSFAKCQNLSNSAKAAGPSYVVFK